MTHFRPTTCEINITNLKNNLEVLTQLNQNHPFFCPMVKANAYGHGDVEVVTILEKCGVKRFGVVLVEEGIRLRENKIQSEILVFGYFDEKSMKECLKWRLTPVIGSFDFLDLYKKNIKDKNSKIHLKIDTGMNRLGFKPDEWKKLKSYLVDNSDIQTEGLCTHFLNGEDSGEEGGRTQEQLTLFQEAEALFKGHYHISHCLNSAALIRKLTFKGARPGIALYGYQPALTALEKKDLKPVMTLKASVIQFKKIKKGESVSYSGTWTAPEDSLIGVVTMGYGDGLPRNFSNNMDVLVQETRVPLIGRVCMDYFMVNLNSLKNKQNLKIGEEVVLWGTQGEEFLSMEEQAKKIGAVSYELMTRVGARVPRVKI